MRLSRFAAALLTALPCALASGQTAAPDPLAILASTRVALGGESQLSAVKTIVATGRTQQVRGNNLVPIEFEMSIQLPDKYIRKDEIPAQANGPSTTGFNGETLIETKAPTVRQDFARLMIGLFATSFAGYPLTFSYVGQAEAPQGTADVLEAKGASNQTMRVFIDRSTHLPIMITWPGLTAPARGAPPAAPQENRIYFADYRDVGGMKWPFRLRRASGPDTVEETIFDRFRVNAKIDPKKFQ